MPIENSIENCDLFSKDIACSECISTKRYQKNKYLYDLKNNNPFLRSFYQEIILSKINFYTTASNAANVCIKITPNCISYEANDQCNKCEDGYFLDDKSRVCN